MIRLEWVRAHRDALLAAAVAAVAVTAFVFLHVTGEATANYDARGHLVVARRIIDAVRPGWIQHGALWLPLPHLLSIPLVWPDALYATGLGVGLVSLAATLGATFHVHRIARRLCENDDLAVATAVVAFGLSPNVVFASATALTEPLLLYVMLAAVDALGGRRLVRAGALFALACATRYEAWPLLPAAALWAAATAPGARLRAVAAVGGTGALGIVAVLVHHAAVAGDPLAFRTLAAGENVSRGIWQLALYAWGRGLVYQAGVPLALLAALGAFDAARAARGDRTGTRALALLLVLPALTPALFYLSGHLFRFRYALAAAPAIALGAAWAARRQPRLAAAALVLHAAWLIHPLYPWYRSSLRLESTWHLQAEPERAVAAHFLRYAHDGRRVLASMASLAPLLWESRLPLRLVVHEGTGTLRDAALARPRDVVGWIVIEANDAFAQAARERPGFFDGFERVFAEGAIEIWRAVGSGRGSERARPTGT